MTAPALGPWWGSRIRPCAGWFWEFVIDGRQRPAREGRRRRSRAALAGAGAGRGGPAPLPEWPARGGAACEDGHHAPGLGAITDEWRLGETPAGRDASRAAGALGFCPGAAA